MAVVLVIDKFNGPPAAGPMYVLFSLIPAFLCACNDGGEDWFEWASAATASYEDYRMLSENHKISRASLLHTR